MAIPILMPKQGMTVESCFLSEWHVKKGNYIKVGMLLFSYETDKAVFDYVSEVEGVVIDILFQQGEIVNVLTPVCFIGEKGETVNFDEQFEQKQIVQTEVKGTDEDPLILISNQEDSKNAYKRHISPRAKQKALKQNINIDELSGSGPNGRIIQQDVKASLTLSTSSTDKTASDEKEQLFSVKPLSNMRKLIGKTMLHSLQSIAQLTHSLSYDITDIIAYRNFLKIRENEGLIPKITLNDILIFAVSRVLAKHSDLNAHFSNQELKVFKDMHIGVATDTKRGLMVPTIFRANTLSLSEISQQAKTLINDCISGSINPDLLSGASFTISNLGSLDIEHFTPIINPPQTGILGINTLRTQVKKDALGRYVFYEAMGLSLTYDHQVVDGAGASRFLKDLKDYLENFTHNIAADLRGLK